MSSVYLYAIGRPQGPIKVGITSNLGGRLSTIQTGCPFRVEVLHYAKMRDRRHALTQERIFHEVHEDSRLSGEWFDMDAELVIESIDDSLAIEQHFIETRGAR